MGPVEAHWPHDKGTPVRGQQVESAGINGSAIDQKRRSKPLVKRRDAPVTERMETLGGAADAQSSMKRQALPTIWQVPDELWARIAPILAELDPPKPTGRKRISARAALDAILFRLRSGCQWNQLPKDFPDDSSVHRTFQRWVQLGLFDRIWAALVGACAELGGVNWEWQAADAAMGKARLGGISLVPIPPTGANLG